MEQSFWLQKWQKNEIGFHNPEAHALLVKHFPQLGLQPGARLILPLCGKTLDIRWLLEQGYRVAGAELSETAIQQLFADLALTPQVAEQRELKHYSAENLDIFVGDMFQLQREALGLVD